MKRVAENPTHVTPIVFKERRFFLWLTQETECCPPERIPHPRKKQPSIATTTLPKHASLLYVPYDSCCSWRWDPFYTGSKAPIEGVIYLYISYMARFAMRIRGRRWYFERWRKKSSGLRGYTRSSLDFQSSSVGTLEGSLHVLQWFKCYAKADDGISMRPPTAWRQCGLFPS